MECDNKSGVREEMENGIKLKYDRKMENDVELVQRPKTGTRRQTGERRAPE